MLKALEGKEPAAAARQMLMQFRDTSLGALNSFVHGGIHPLQRNLEGYPLPLLINIQKNSNALLTMCGMMLAILSGSREVQMRMKASQRDFEDCLPDLLPV
jgi:hypothetical protein